MKNKTLSGFTLIELSLVLVIIGLIIGGILTGQELIHQATLRKVISELQQLNVAIKTFQGKYNCLPGDCTNATAYFGTDSNCPTGAANSTGTCNGNGDGIIATNLTGINPIEDAYALNQLGLSGLIPAVWPDGPGSGSACCHHLAVGTTGPVSAYSVNVGYQLFTSPNNAAFPTIETNKLVILIGASDTSITDYLAGAGIIAPDAAAIDKKMDDGLPGSAGFIGINALFAGPGNSNTTCLSGSNYSAAAATGCTLFYNIQ